MFNNAICEIIELHIKDFDKSKNGIHGKLSEVSDMLIVFICLFRQFNPIYGRGWRS